MLVGAFTGIQKYNEARRIVANGNQLIAELYTLCAGYLDYPFLKNNTQQENSQAPWRRIGFTCLPVTLRVLGSI
jgi:hypothetical protein